MLKQLFAALLLTSVAVAQPFTPREGPVIISQPGTGGTSSGGGLDTNAVIALIEQYGGGGISSNAFLSTLDLATAKTNGSDYLYVSIPLKIGTPSGTSSANANGAYLYMRAQGAGTATNVSSAFIFGSPAGETNTLTVSGFVPPDFQWGITTAIGAGGTVVLDPSGTSGNSSGVQLVYFGSGTNSGGGGGVSAAQVISIISTNYVAGATNIVDNMLVRNSYYVSSAYGSDTNNGSSGSPWQTIGYANSNAVTGSTVYIGPGTYLQGIWKSGVIWDLADGAIISLSGSDLCVTATNEANVIVIGKGALKNTDSNPSVLKDETSSAEITCKFIQGGFSLSGKYTNDTKFLVDAGFISVGGIVSMFDYADVGLCEVSINNARIYIWDDSSAEFPFTMSGCVSKSALAANALRIGTVLVNTNISVTLNTP